ncbi:MAG: DUF1801 domain-containing protein [Candidatus Promineofilum sp.]|nr:DUF1801 domain-containing protein [Promineifilum sp.]
MAENKTQFTDASVASFLDAVPDDRKRQDSYALLEMMRQITGEEPHMYGTSIVGFGKYHYKYASGREGDMPIVGFSPRKQNLTLYLLSESDEYQALRARLGKHKVGKSCLYINKLSDIDEEALREMVRLSVEHMRRHNP